MINLNKKREQISMEELMEISVESGYTLPQVVNGYEVFYSDEIMSGALHIQRLDVVMKFNSDREASIQAEKDGIKLIHDLPILETHEDFAYFIDTKENREIIREHLKQLGIKYKG